MNVLQNNLEPSKIAIDLKNKQITGIELKVISCENPSIAFEFIEETVTMYLQFQSQKLKSDLDKSRSELDNNSDPFHKQLPSQVKSSEEKEEEESAQFRAYLDNRKNYDVQNYTWRQINTLVNEQLSVLEDEEQSDKIIELFGKFSRNVGDIKREQGIKGEEISYLRNIKLSNKIPESPMEGFQGIDVIKYFVNPSQTKVFDLDFESLSSRIEYCKSIKERIQRILKQSIEKLPFQNEESFTFAPVKGLARSATKLSEYQEKIKKSIKTQTTPVSALQNLKDLLRGSIVTRTPAESAQVVECIERIPGVKIVEFKNGFYTADPSRFDPTKQADIKLILRVGGGHLNMRQEELVEVQIIQDVNIKLKKLEHKIYDFIREKDTIQAKVTENATIVKQTSTFMKTQDESAASQVNNSHVNNLRFVRDRLLEYQPYNQFDNLGIDEIFKSRQSWRETKFKYMTDRIDLLKFAQGAFEYIKIIKTSQGFDVDFKIDNTKIQDDQKNKFELSRNKLASVGMEFYSRFIKQLGDIFYQNDKQQTDRSNGQIKYVISSHDGKYLQVARQSIITKTCAKTGTIIQKYQNQNLNDIVLCLALSPYGDHLQSGSGTGSQEYENSIMKTNTITGEKKAIQKYHRKEVNCLTVSPDGQYLQSGSMDFSIVKTNTSTGKKIAAYVQNEHWVICLSLSPDGLQLQSGNAQGVVKSDTTSGEKIDTWKHHDNWVTCLTISPDGQYLQSGGKDLNIVKTNTNTGAKIESQSHHSNVVECLALSQDGQYLQSGGSDLTVVKQNITTGTKLATYKLHSHLNNIALSPDGLHLQIGHYDASLVKQNTTTQEGLSSFKPHEREAVCLALSHDSEQIQTGSKDGTVVKTNTKTGKKLATQNHQRNTDVLCLALSPDGLHVQTGCMDGKITITNTDTGDNLAPQDHRRGQVLCLALSPDGLILQSGSSDGSITKTNTKTGVKLASQEQHKKEVLCLVLSPDGLYIQSGSKDKCIIKTNINTGQKVMTYKQLKDVQSLALSPDGLYVYSGCFSKNLVKTNTITGMVTFEYNTSLQSSKKSIVLYDDFLIAQSDQKKVLIYQISTGELVKTIEISKYALTQMIIDKLDSMHLQISDESGTISCLECDQML